MEILSSVIYKKQLIKKVVQDKHTLQTTHTKSPWCPLSPEVRIPLNHNMVVTVLEPMPSLRDTYITNVQKMGGNVE